MTTVSTFEKRASAKPSSARYRWLVASRALAAIVGGYALTSVVIVFVSLLLPLAPAEAVAATTILSFILYAVIIVWAFSVKRLRTVWLGLLIPTLLCSGLVWLLLPGASV